MFLNVLLEIPADRGDEHHLGLPNSRCTCGIQSRAAGHAFTSYGARIFNVFDIYETNARTTFENAVYIKRLLEKHYFKSVLLVTSTWHMPRSYFLLKIQLLFSGIKIYRVGLDCSSNVRLSWRESAKIRKLVYHEFAKLWGSVGEYFIYLLNGKLPEKNLKEMVMFKS